MESQSEPLQPNEFANVLPDEAEIRETLIAVKAKLHTALDLARGRSGKRFCLFRRRV